jgi:hypothetical protein
MGMIIKMIDPRSPSNRAINIYINFSCLPFQGSNFGSPINNHIVVLYTGYAAVKQAKLWINQIPPDPITPHDLFIENSPMEYPLGDI